MHSRKTSDPDLHRAAAPVLGPEAPAQLKLCMMTHVCIGVTNVTSAHPGNDGGGKDAHEDAAPEAARHQHGDGDKPRDAQPHSGALHLVAHAGIAGGRLRSPPPHTQTQVQSSLPALSVTGLTLSPAGA